LRHAFYFSPLPDLPEADDFPHAGIVDLLHLRPQASKQASIVQDGIF
jgi:hypothetical protein